tara:strand:+ start:435 stop:1388 length:954 start_codon:yes stop_codon:yes gene_type:complete
MKKKAIIFGVSGQDGAYLSSFLLNKKYEVIGTTRNKGEKNLFRLKKLNIHKKVKVYQGDATKIDFCKKLIKKNINEIYYLAGESSVTKSFKTPNLSLLSNTMGLTNILETVKIQNSHIKVFNASSGQIYGNKKNNFFNINSKIDPQSPYGISKAAGYWMTKIYRENYNIYCCSGVLFNHESPLRSDDFVTKKIINVANEIHKKKNRNLLLGDVNIHRDWGWAPDYVEAYWLMLQQKKAKDLIIGSGKVYSLKDFVREVFKLKKISLKKVKTNVKKFKRKLDIKGYKANITYTKQTLKWKPKVSFKKIVYKMVNNELF